MKKGFTLFEMMIVIGLIIGVAVLILPALRSGREQALSAQ